MANNKIVLGNETLIDLTGDTVTADTLALGMTAHGADGDPIWGGGTELLPSIRKRHSDI